MAVALGELQLPTNALHELRGSHQGKLGIATRSGPGRRRYLLSEIEPKPRLTVATHFPVADDTVASAFQSVTNHCPTITMGKDIVWSFDLMVLRVFPDRIEQRRAVVSDYCFNPPAQMPKEGLYPPKYDDGSGKGDPHAQIDPSAEIPPTNPDGTVNYRSDGY